MPAGAVTIDGRPCAPAEAVVSVYDRGFLYGDGVFESLRTYEGEPSRLGEHVQRLFASARALRIAPNVSPELVQREALATIARARSQAPTDDRADCYVRIMLTRGGGRLGVAIDPSMVATRVVIAEPLVPIDAAAYERGLALVTVRAPSPLAESSAAGAKALRYLAFIVANAEARERGGDEALLVDTEGSALEGATSNVFAVMGGAVVTAPIARGILPGITRRAVLELGRDLAIAVEERSFVASDPDVTEVFVTSSLREVMPATRLDGRDVGAGSPGPVTRRIHAAFRRSLPGAPAPLLRG